MGRLLKEIREIDFCKIVVNFTGMSLHRSIFYCHTFFVVNTFCYGKKRGVRLVVPEAERLRQGVGGVVRSALGPAKHPERSLPQPGDDQVS